MTQDRAIASRKHRSDPPALATDALRPGHVDASVHFVQIPASESGFDGSLAEAQAEQLASPHHAMLSPRKPGHLAIPKASVHFAVVMTAK
jgi:hypothetical protein